MKKKILYIITIVFLSSITYAQCDDCYEGVDISTNPTDPENCEVDEEYPTKTNQYLNSFDWAKRTTNNNGTFSFNTIKLNPNAGWQVPNFTNPSYPILMQSPYALGFLDMGGGTPIEDYDFAWEDGWELMYLNTGYFPNGDWYEDPDALGSVPIISDPLNLHDTKVPYIVLYNRYNGKLRTFFNVFADLGTANDVALDLGYINTATGDNISGIFRHGSGYDTPLDQQTTTDAFSTHFENYNNMTQWFMTDVQLGYDPCVCDYFSQFDFKLQAIDVYDVNLLGRSIAVEQPLQDAQGNPTYTDFLNMNNGVGQHPDGSGLLIYRTLDGMLDDYNAELKAYKDDLNEYNSLGNQAQQAMIDLGKTTLKLGVKALVPKVTLVPLVMNAVGILGSSDLDGLAYNYTNENAKFKEFDKSVDKNLKATAGTMSDALFASFYTKPSKPVKPSMPAATFTEMKIKGTISKSSAIDIGDLYTPGSFHFGNSFSRSAYPIYNKPVGLFALLETPNISVYRNSDERLVTSSPVRRYLENEIKLKLNAPLKYRFNNAVDIDKERTEIYVQFQVDYSMPIDEPIIHEVVQTNSNLKLLHHFETDIINSIGSKQWKTTFSSDWYPINLVGEKTLGTKFREDDGWIGANVVEDINHLPDSLIRITMKIMADMYFDSPGFDGTEKNTTQVFTYLLYDARSGVDFIDTKGEWLTDPSSISQYLLGKLTLDNEVIETTDAFVTEVVGTDIYVKAEEIELKGNISVQSGYNAIIQAYWGIESDPTTEIGQNIELAIKRDFYNFPETIEVDDTELASFCKGTNKKYQANVKTKRSNEEEIEEPIPPTFNFNLYPNPGSHHIQVESQSAECLGYVYDAYGQLLADFNVENHRASFDASSWSNGIYFVKLVAENNQSVKRFVKK